MLLVLSLAVVIGTAYAKPEFLARTATIQLGALILIIIIGFGPLTIMGWDMLRWMSPPVVTATHWWPHNHGDKVLPLGDYVAIRLGGIDAWGFSFKGKRGTVIAHESSLDPQPGKARYVNGVTRPVRPEALPKPMRDELSKHGFRAPFYFDTGPGWVQQVRAEHLRNFNTWEEANEMVANVEKAYRVRNRGWEHTAAFQGRALRMVNQPKALTLIERMKASLTGKTPQEGEDDFEDDQ